ncbi:hypothetical protein M7I_6449 [Glarea lozoyensis 74030]|uniref:Uncharacterized protein n=1 Tax=Glarea lozoyensis (strain ATCC 74030 / MF5533) TaxID=1104152 RepID=H0EUL2_GLAL7|nr:hypothetical protein M7I_6449 [Glarea lozoyensis 74030]
MFPALDASFATSGASSNISGKDRLHVYLLGVLPTPRLLCSVK